MPHPDDFPGDFLDAVADEIGSRLPMVLGSSLDSSTSIAITSSLQVWELTADRIAASSDVDLTSLAEPSGRWHHQISVDGKPEVYARSTAPVPGAARPEVDEVVRSPVVARLDAAIDLADRVGEDDEVARLLVAGEFHLWALWLVGTSGTGRVVVVDAPYDLDLDPDRLYPDAELVRQLRQVKPIVGIEPD